MGILLTFMFLWNMLGALVLIPALSYFLLPDKRFVAAEPETCAAPTPPDERVCQPQAPTRMSA